MKRPGDTISRAHAREIARHFLAHQLARSHDALTSMDSPMYVGHLTDVLAAHVRHRRTP